MSVKKQRERDMVRVLDPVKVRAARIAAGMSESMLGGAMGLSPNVFRNLEHGGDQRYHDVRFLRDLARLVGVREHELLVDRNPPAEPDGGTCDEVSDEDVREVGALVAAVGGFVAVDVLASVSGWTVARVLVALEDLDERLGAVGQRLRWVHDTHVAVAADEPDADRLAGIHRHHLDTAGLDIEEATLLYKLAVSGPNHRYAELPVMALRRLRKTGLVDIAVLPDGERGVGQKNGEGARLSDAARHALVI